MIFGTLKDSARYEQLNPRFKKAFDWIKSANLAELEAGKTVLEPDALFINISDSQLKAKGDAKLEVHRKYVDIQVPISAAESYGWKARDQCATVSKPFDTEKDIMFYDDTPTTYFTLQPEQFCIFFPEDAHAPCVGTGTLRKIIVKVII